jgi:hypothetical protein
MEEQPQRFLSLWTEFSQKRERALLPSKLLQSQGLASFTKERPHGSDIHHTQEAGKMAPPDSSEARKGLAKESWIVPCHEENDG